MAFEKVLIDGLEQDNTTDDVKIDFAKASKDLKHFIEQEDYKISKITLESIVLNLVNGSLSVVGRDKDNNLRTVFKESELLKKGDLKDKLKDKLDEDLEEQIEKLEQEGP